MFNTVYNKIIKYLEYENQIGDSIVILIDTPNNKHAELLITSAKRGNLKIYEYLEDLAPEYIRQSGPARHYLTSYKIDDDNYNYSKFIKPLGIVEDSEIYRDGGITTDKKALAELIIKNIERVIAEKRRVKC